MSAQDQPEFPTYTASARHGAITVTTTDQGLPVGISIEADDLRGDPRDLAAELLRLCRQSAERAQLARRAELSAAGVTDDVLAMMGLPKPAQVAARELADEQDYDMEPQSWLRQA